MIKKENKTPKALCAKALCGVLNEIADTSCADFAPSFYNLDFIWCEIDTKQPNYIVLSDSDKNDDPRQKFRITIEEI